LKIGVSEAIGSVWRAQNFKYKGSSPTNHSSCRKTTTIDLSYCIKMWTEVSFVLSQFTHLTDGRTDGRTSGSWL